MSLCVLGFADEEVALRKRKSFVQHSMFFLGVRRSDDHDRAGDRTYRAPTYMRCGITGRSALTVNEEKKKPHH